MWVKLTSGTYAGKMYNTAHLDELYVFTNGVIWDVRGTQVNSTSVVTLTGSFSNADDAELALAQILAGIAPVTP